MYFSHIQLKLILNQYYILLNNNAQQSPRYKREALAWTCQDFHQRTTGFCQLRLVTETPFIDFLINQVSSSLLMPIKNNDANGGKYMWAVLMALFYDLQEGQNGPML